MSERSAVHDVERGPHSPDAGSPSSPLSLDRLLDVLATDHRRRVVEHLSHRGESVSLDSLAAEVASTHDDDSEGDAAHKSTRIALYHSHLPKLVDSDVIEFDHDSGVVSPGPQLRTASGALDAVEDARLH